MKQLRFLAGLIAVAALVSAATAGFAPGRAFEGEKPAAAVSGERAPAALQEHREPLPDAREATAKAVAAAEAMDRAYRELRMSSRTTTFDQRGEITSITDNEYLRSRDSTRISTTVVESKLANLREGRTTVFGGSSECRFMISRDGEEGDFALDLFGPHPAFEMVATARALPAFMPYQILDVRLADFIRDADVSISEVDRTTFADRPAIMLIADYRGVDDDGPFHVRYHLHFATESWVFLGFTMLTPDQPESRALHYRVRYAPGAGWPPGITEVEIASGDSEDPGGEVVRVRHEVDTLALEYVAAAEFTLAAFGIAEPPEPIHPCAP